MADNLKVLEHFESENRDSVEPVGDELRGQVANGECVAIRGKPREERVAAVTGGRTGEARGGAIKLTVARLCRLILTTHVHGWPARRCTLTLRALAVSTVDPASGRSWFC